MEILRNEPYICKPVPIVDMIYKRIHNQTHNQAVYMNLPHSMKNSTEPSLTNESAINVPKTSQWASLFWDKVWLVCAIAQSLR